MEERLQKYMARCGIASRRKCEELIAQGLVEVNGRVVREPGVRIDPRSDRVRVDGKALAVEQAAHYLHYKVKGVTTTVSDDLGRKTVMDCLPGIRERVYPVGRLDRESEGLLVLTNDGELANYLTHPAFGVEKTYRVTAEGRVEPDVLRQLAEKGIRLGPALVRPTRVELVRHDNDNTIVLISVAEGINREVRRIFAALGHEVKKLLRVQVGPLTLAGLKRGGTRALTPKELANIRKGMAAADPTSAAELFPPGSAAQRKPKGPRGRARPVARARAGAADGRKRQGKPDPATNREFAKKKRDKPVSATTGARGGKPPMREARPSARLSGRPSGGASARPSGEKSARPSAKPYGKPFGEAFDRPRGRTSTRPSGETYARSSGRPSTKPSGKSSGGAPARPFARSSARPSAKPYASQSARPSTKPSGKAGSGASRRTGSSAAPKPRPRLARHPLAPPRKKPGGRGGAKNA